MAILASKPFVVFEKNHKIGETPRVDGAEAKIVASCEAVKQVNPKTDCYMYVESDMARTFYSLGHWVEDHKETAALQCNGSYVTQSWKETDGGVDYSGDFYAYDFANAEMRAQWVARVADAVAGGSVDGAFIDGDRNGFSSTVLNGCDDDKRSAWAAGLNASVAALAEAIGPSKTLISNYPTTDALKLCQGGMMERGGSMLDIQSWSSKTCGLDKGPCLLDYHAQNAQQSLRNFNSSLVNFLVGANEYSYFGVGSGWSGDGEGACKEWLFQYPEYSMKLGEPKSDAVVTNGTLGLACTLLDAKPSKKDISGCLFAREFASGTKVFLGQHAPPTYDATNEQVITETDALFLGSANYGACIWWSDGATTGNLTNCPSKDEA